MLSLLKKAWIKLQDRSDFSIDKILFSEKGRDIFLDDQRIVSLDPSAIRRDATRIIKYAETQDYAAFAREVYMDIIYSIDKLTHENMSGPETDFYRGRLSQGLDLLKISFKAHKKLRESRETKA